MEENLLKALKSALLGLLMVVTVLAGEHEIGNATDAARHMALAKSSFIEGKYDSSLFYYQTAAGMWRAERNWPKFLESQYGLANSWMRKARYDKAKEILIAAEQFNLTEQHAPCAEMGTIYILLGYYFNHIEDLASAERYTIKGIETIRETKGERNSGMASAYYTLQGIQYTKGDYDAALISAERTIDLQTELFGSSYPYLANTWTSRGMIYDAKNEFDSAIASYEKALIVIKQSNRLNSQEAGYCYTNMMSTYNEKGAYRTSIEYGKKAIAIYEGLGLPEHNSVASIYSKLGEVYTTLGDYEKAKELLLRSLDIFTAKQISKKEGVASVLVRLGDLYKRIGDHSAAILHSEKGIAIFEEAYGQFHPQVGYRYEQLAGIYLDVQRYNDAITYYGKAITARERVTSVSSPNDIALLYAAIGTAHLKKNSLDSAGKYFRRSFDLQKKSLEKIPVYQARVRQRLGDLAFAEKKFESALEQYHAALGHLTSTVISPDVYSLPSLESSPYLKDLQEIVVSKGQTLEKLYRRSGNVRYLRGAFEHYRQGMEIVDNVRREYFSEGSKLYLAGSSSSIFRNTCRLALELYEKTGDRHFLEQAFLASDRSKGNILLESLIAGEAKQYSGIPDSLLTIERDLQSSLIRAETQIARLSETDSKNNAVDQTNLKGKYFDAKQQYQSFVEMLEKRYPKYFELKHARYSLTVADLQKHIDSGSVMIEYLADESALFAFVLTRNSFDVRTVNGTSRIQSLAKKFSTSLKTYDAAAYCAAGYDLYSALLQPLKTIPAMKTSASIKIIPDGFLHYVPFEALPMRRYSARSVDFTAVDYLVSRYDVSYSYSAAFDMREQRRKEGDGSSSMSFAGFAPVFRDSLNNGDFFANRSFVEGSGISDVRSITLDGRTFNELKFSEEEIVSIGKTFAEKSIPSKNFLHTFASEKNFKQFAPAYDIIHVATHGFINEKNPKLSAVLFSQPKDTTDDEDGVLYVNETFGLNLNARLVVLSSCESGVGQLVDGEGMIALSRGLFYAGAKNIIFSLWKVSDKQTYLLMDEFYRTMISGRSYAASLRAAKLSLIAKKESAFPSKWSGFVLIGR